jgi:putative addiction module component (TIGR02574 family)
MAPTLHELGLDRLSLEDRLALAEAIWESVASDTENASISDELRAELERRLADSISNPHDVISWETIKAKALERAKI